MTGYLDHTQVDVLLRPINTNRVSSRDGNSYVQAYDIRRWLISTFGFGRWSGDVIEATLLYEDVFKGTKPAKGGGTYEAHTVSVGYLVRLKLTVCAPDGTVLATYTEAAAGDATNFPINKRGDAHDFAVKTAESQALKRCAINLGDGGGLGLYNAGQTSALVRFVLGPDQSRINDDGTVSRPAQGEKQKTDDAHIDAPLAPENPPVGQAEPETPPQPASPAAPTRQGTDVPKSSQVADLRDRALAATKKAELLRLLMEAGKAQLGQEMTSDEDNRGMTLDDFINTRIRLVA